MISTGIFVDISTKTTLLDGFYHFIETSKFISNIFNICIGIFSSIIAWFILYHVIVPKISFSKIISKSIKKSDPCGYSYRVKLWNVGIRDVVDLDVYIKIKIKGLTKQRNLWHTIELTKRFDKITYLAAGENRLILFFPNNKDRFQEKIFPEYIRKKSLLQTLTLEDILKLGSRSLLRVYVLGNDTFSGSRKIFLSKKYSINDIKMRKFRKEDRDNFIYKNKRTKSFIKILTDGSESN